MKKNNFTSWQGTAAVGGLSTIVISYLQFGGSSISPDLIKFYTAIAPVVSGGVVTVGNWGLAFFGVRSLTSMRAEQVNNKILKKLEKQITKAEKLGVPTDKLKEKYAKASIASTVVDEQEVIALTTGD